MSVRFIFVPAPLSGRCQAVGSGLSFRPSCARRSKCFVASKHRIARSAYDPDIGKYFSTFQGLQATFSPSICDNFIKHMLCVTNNVHVAGPRGGAPSRGGPGSPGASRAAGTRGRSERQRKPPGPWVSDARRAGIRRRKSKPDFRVPRWGTRATPVRDGDRRGRFRFGASSSRTCPRSCRILRTRSCPRWRIDAQAAPPLPVSSGNQGLGRILAPAAGIEPATN